MGINAQASQVGTGRGAGSSVTMWIVVAAVVVVSMVAAGIVTALRTETATPTNGHVPLWNAAKLDAMEGRMLAESIRINGYTPLWNAAKLDAMEGRMLAESIRIKQAAPSGTVSVPEAPAPDASTGGSSQGKRQIGSGSAVAPGGYVLNGSAQYIPQQR
jgi:hypothetical protein